MGKFNASGNINHYDFTLGKFINILDFESSNKDFATDMMAGNNRLLVSSVAKVNGKKTSGFAYIDQDSIITINDKNFSDSGFYFIDPKNDHIYSSTYSTTPLIKQYSDHFIDSRQTNEIGHLIYEMFGVINGQIVMGSMDTNGRTFVNILCTNETKWKTLETTDNYKNIFYSTSGFYE